MAKYGKSAAKNVASAMRRKKKGTLKSGSGRKVTSRKQAIAIGLSEAREKGAKVPSKKKAKGAVEKEEVTDGHPRSASSGTPLWDWGISHKWPCCRHSPMPGAIHVSSRW